MNGRGLSHVHKDKVIVQRFGPGCHISREQTGLPLDALDCLDEVLALGAGEGSPVFVALEPARAMTPRCLGGQIRHTTPV